MQQKLNQFEKVEKESVKMKIILIKKGNKG